MTLFLGKLYANFRLTFYSYSDEAIRYAQNMESGIFDKTFRDGLKGNEPLRMVADKPNFYEGIPDFGTQVQKFHRTVDVFTQGKRFSRPIEILDKTPKLLQKLGFANYPIKITSGILNKIIKFHDISAEQVKQIPLQLANPVMVYDSIKKDGSKVVVTDLFDKNDNPIVIIVKEDKQNAFNRINIIPSMHQREDKKSFSVWLEKRLLNFVNTQKSQKWMLSAGLQLPLDASASDNSNILTEDDFVKKDSILRKVADLSDFDSAEYIKRRDAIPLEKNDKGELLTPGGKVSNIQNETLWRTVRTREFLEWFGDWQSNELRKTLEGFSNIKVSSSIAPTQGKTKDIVEWSKKVLPNSVTNKTLGEVIINAQTIKASLAHGYGKSKIRSILAIPQIIEKGILVHSEINTESKRFQGEMFVLAHPVKIDGDTFQAFVLIRKDINSSRLYVHEVVEIQKLQMLSKTGAKAKKQPHIRASGVIRSIAERLYLNQENVSKVVDENGEPLQVFHSTDKDFDTFDTSKSFDGNLWFTKDIDAINNQETGAGASGTVMPVFLNIRNIAGWNEYENLLIPQIESEGFDGIQLDDDFVTFNPNQIKSIFNRGSYSNNENSILRKVVDTESRQFFKDLQYYTLDQKLPFIMGGTLKDGEIEISEAEAVTIGQILGGDMFFGLFLPPQFASETVGSLNRLADDAMQAGYLIRLFGMA